jgi:hypothetical protein
MKLFELQNPSLPIRKMIKVFHVGSMDASHKRSGSYEGSGLSVSLHPDEWRRIARGAVSGDTWVLTKPTGSFLNFHKINKRLKGTIVQWGINQKLVKSSEVYRVSWYDDELDDMMQSDFPDRKTAEAEAEYMDTEVEVIPGGIVGTPKLSAAAGYQVSPGMAFDILVTVWVEQATQLDGVWWNDRLDPDALSAPRGVIGRSKLSSWSAQQLSSDQF